MGCLKEADQRAVKDFSGERIKEIAQCQEISLRNERCRCSQSTQNSQGIRSAYSNYSDRASPWRSTKSNDRISLIVHGRSSDAKLSEVSLAGRRFQTNPQATCVAFANRLCFEI